MTEPILLPKTEPAPEYPGFHYEWMQDPDWNVALGHSCSFNRCLGVSVGLFVREVRSATGCRMWRRYHCCAEHLYGRRVNGDVIEFRRLVPDQPDGSTA